MGSWVAAHVKREFEEASDRVEMEMYANRCNKALGVVCIYIVMLFS